MPRKPRVQFAGAIYHVMSRGDRRENIFLDDVDRQDFLKTLAEACQKTAFQVHAYCLMSNHFHAVIETPNANLVEGMRWFLSAYTLRLNHRHKLFGHVFSGRYKAVLVEGSTGSYLKTACDYVHLNPIRAKLLDSEDRIFAYPWSSLTWYLSAREHRPLWMRTDRLLAAHGVADNAVGRHLFEKNMEARRATEDDGEEWKALRRGWCLGSEGFKNDLLERISGDLRPSHAGEMKLESAEAKAERIIAEELQRLGWTSSDLQLRLKTDPAKVQMALRLRAETTLTVRWIAERLNLGTAKSANVRIHAARQTERRKGNVIV
jgi:REP element-mobilizing transposase RayT